VRCYLRDLWFAMGWHWLLATGYWVLCGWAALATGYWLLAT
jgi:hypothetical protein